MSLHGGSGWKPPPPPPGYDECLGAQWWLPPAGWVDVAGWLAACRDLERETGVTDWPVPSALAVGWSGVEPLGYFTFDGCAWRRRARDPLHRPMVDSGRLRRTPGLDYSDLAALVEEARPVTR